MLCPTGHVSASTARPGRSKGWTESSSEDPVPRNDPDIHHFDENVGVVIGMNVVSPPRVDVVRMLVYIGHQAMHGTRGRSAAHPRVGSAAIRSKRSVPSGGTLPEYPHPSLTVDCVVFGLDEGDLKVLLV